MHAMFGVIRYYRRAFQLMIREPALRHLLVATLLVLAAGTAVYRIAEDWSWVDSLYFCAITLTTIGYGDLTPTSDFDKLFTVLYALMGLGIVATFVTVLIRAPIMAESRDNEAAAEADQPKIVLPERPSYRPRQLGTASGRDRR